MQTVAIYILVCAFKYFYRKLHNIIKKKVFKFILTFFSLESNSSVSTKKSSKNKEADNIEMKTKEKNS